MLDRQRIKKILPKILVDFIRKLIGFRIRLNIINQQKLHKKNLQIIQQKAKRKDFYYKYLMSKALQPSKQIKNHITKSIFK